MKIIYWNIFKLGSSKLNNKMNATSVANGLGNNLNDYVVKVATGDAVWGGATSTTPVDALLIIELVSGGNAESGDEYSSQRQRRLCLRLCAAQSNRPPGDRGSDL